MNLTIFIDERELSQIIHIATKNNIWITHDEVKLHKEVMKPYNWKLSMDDKKVGKIMSYMDDRDELKERLQRAGEFQCGWKRDLYQVPFRV